MKSITALYFLCLAFIFLLFFGYAYPVVPFWGDDWTIINGYGSLIPTWGSWIPARLLPLFLETFTGVLGAYVIMPISGLDFIDSITCASAILLSASSVSLLYVLYRLLLAISAHQIFALFSLSVFVLAGFCASKAVYMPLWLPGDLRNEGLGYLLTTMSFYILPNMLNLALLALLMLYQYRLWQEGSYPFTSLNCGEVSYEASYNDKKEGIADVQRTKSKNAPFFNDASSYKRNSLAFSFIAGGGGGVILYLSQFSMTSSALILSTYCGVSLVFHLYQMICYRRFYASKSALNVVIKDASSQVNKASFEKISAKDAQKVDSYKANAPCHDVNNTKHQLPKTSGTFKQDCAPMHYVIKLISTLLHKLTHLGFYELFLLLPPILFIIALIYDTHSGRIQYCSTFSLSFGISYMLESLRSLRVGAIALIVLSFFMLCVLSVKERYLRTILLLHAVYLVALGVLYMLIVSKCGARYFLMSGLLLSMLFIWCVWVALLCKEGYARWGGKMLCVMGFVACFALLHPFEPRVERPRDSYHFHRAYAKAWVAMVQHAESSGQDSLTIYVPSEIPHWRWSWFYNNFPHTLKNYGVIRRDIRVEFKEIK